MAAHGNCAAGGARAGRGRTGTDVFNRRQSRQYPGCSNYEERRNRARPEPGRLPGFGERSPASDSLFLSRKRPAVDARAADRHEHEPASPDGGRTCGQFSICGPGTARGQRSGLPDAVRPGLDFASTAHVIAQGIGSRAKSGRHANDERVEYGRRRWDIALRHGDQSLERNHEEAWGS